MCTDCSSGPDPAFSLREVLMQHIEPLGVPALFNADIGHEEVNFTLPMGIEAELDADAGTLALLEPAVLQETLQVSCEASSSDRFDIGHSICKILHRL